MTNDVCINCLNLAVPGSWYCEKCVAIAAESDQAGLNSPSRPAAQKGYNYWRTAATKAVTSTSTPKEKTMSDNVATLHKPLDESVEHVWTEATLNQINKFAKLVEDIGKKRTALNDSLAAGKSALVEIGMNKDALAAAISYAKTPEDERLNWDATYIFTRKALGCPLQEDLFMAAMADTVTVETPKDKNEKPI